MCIFRILANFGILAMCHILVAVKLASPRKISSLLTESALVTLGVDGKAVWTRDIILSSSAGNTKVTLVLFPSMSALSSEDSVVDQKLKLHLLKNKMYIEIIYVQT